MPELIPDFLVTARSLAEYRQMFDLTDTELNGRTVLDCPGGAASFTAEAHALGAHVTAVDPVYAMTAGDLAVRALDDAARGRRWIAEHHDNYEWSTFGDVQDHYAHRVGAVGLFVRDLHEHSERYVCDALPQLQFPEAQFSLVLCSNLLFSYDDRMNLDAHLAALREMLRVCRDEVRVFPLLGYGGARSAFVDPIIAALRAEGVAVDLRPVPYRFQRAATEMLIMTRS